LDSALVELFDADGMKLKSKVVDSTGVYNFDVDCGMTYTLKGTKEGYEDDTKIFTTTTENKKVNEIDLILTPLPCVIKTDPIFFPFDEYYITEKAEKALRPVLDTLLVNRKIRIKIESHTDTRGSDEYNEVLSDNRAKSTRDYLIKQGVHTSQIESAIGYGEYRLCYTDAQINALPTRDEREAIHQKNRRSRFVIVDCDDGTRDCEE
jgi:outer membrane protein OmpA-like peptidoglycan-associated protein